MNFYELWKRAEIEDKKNVNNTPTKKFKELEQELLNNVQYEYDEVIDFAKKFKSADVKAMQNKVMEIMNNEYNDRELTALFNLALIDGVDVKPIGKIIADKAHGSIDVEEKDNIIPKDVLNATKEYLEFYGETGFMEEESYPYELLSRNYIFAYAVKGADVKAHQKVIMKYGKKAPEFYYYFARDIKGAEVKKLEQAFLNCEKIINWKNPSTLMLDVTPEYYANFAYKFAKDIKDANVKAHEKIVLKAKDANISLEFAKNVKGADLKAHGEIIKASGDKKLIREYKNLLIKNYFKNKKAEKQNSVEEEMTR